MASFWALLGASWKLFLCVFGFEVATRIFKTFFFTPSSPHLGPRGARKSPKQLPGRPHGEGDGPTKPPRSRIPAFLRVIVSPGGLITRKNAGILLLGGFLGPLPRHEGVNHTYFTYDRALGRLQLADGGP